MKSGCAYRPLRAGMLMLCFLAICVSFCAAFGSRDSGLAKNQVIRSTVRIIGNEPHTMVAITTEDGSKSYLVVASKSEREIRDLQGHLVDFSVSMIEKNSSPIPPGIDGAVEIISWKIVK